MTISSGVNSWSLSRSHFGVGLGAHTDPLLLCGMMDSLWCDPAVSKLAAFHADLLEMLSSCSGASVLTVNGGLQRYKHVLPRPLQARLRKLDLAYKVVRHLS